MTRDYVLCGRRLRSDLELPGLPSPAGEGEPELRLETRAFESPKDPARARALLVSAHASADVVRVPGSLGLRVEKDRFTVDLAPGVAPSEAGPFLLGTGLALWARRNGLVAFRGAVVEHDAGRVALLGPSGSGKSTFAAALCRRGFRLLSDGVVVVDPASRRLLPTAAVVPLWRDAAEALGIATEGLPRTRPGLEKFFWPAPAPSGPDLPLTAVWLLSEDSSHAPSISFDRLPAGRALSRLQASLHGAEFDFLPDARARAFLGASYLATAGVREISRPAGFSALEELVDRIAAAAQAAPAREAP